MLLSPKKTKFRKYRKFNKGNIRSFTEKNAFLDKGDFGLKMLDPGSITAKQLEAVRTSLSRVIKKQKGLIFCRLFPSIPVTKKPAEVRMGGGKGGIDHWKCLGKPGTIIFEVLGVEKMIAKKALEAAGHKLGIRTTVVERLI